MFDRHELETAGRVGCQKHPVAGVPKVEIDEVGDVAIVLDDHDVAVDPRWVGRSLGRSHALLTSRGAGSRAAALANLAAR